MTQTGTTPSTPSKPRSEVDLHEHEMEEYGGGAIEARHGYIPVWLLIVYACFSSGDSIMPTIIGVASGRDGSPETETP